ncbi:MAG: SDR family oxidoreductase, partial [Caulobacteraceae bacterium]
MHVFATGATGFIGSALVKELIASGHEVLGLCRSEEKAAALAASGAEVHRGSLEDLESVRDGARRCEGVIHLAFNHDFANYAANCEDDRRVIAALGAVLAGSRRPLIVTSGTAMAMGEPGRPVAEEDAPLSSKIAPRAASEEAAAELAAEGVNVSVVRLSQVHDAAWQGLVSPAIEIYRQKGVCAYLGEGANRWPAAHVSDVARLFRLAIERAEPNARWHAVAEEGVAMCDIAKTLGRRLELPVRSIGAEEAAEFFGWLAMFAGLDAPASSARTRERLGWAPSGPSLLADLEQLD